MKLTVEGIADGPFQAVLENAIRQRVDEYKRTGREPRLLLVDIDLKVNIPGGSRYRIAPILFVLDETET